MYFLTELCFQRDWFEELWRETSWERVTDADPTRGTAND